MIILMRISKTLLSNEIYGLVAANAIIFNPFIISTMGLESILFITFFIVTYYLFISKKWLFLAVSLGLLTMIRADGFLIFLIYLIFIPIKRERWKLLLVYLLSIAPWYLFSWIYLGSLIPETFFLKTWQKEWWGFNYFNGLTLYLSKYPIETSLSFCFLPFAFIFLLLKNNYKVQLFALAFIAAIHFIFYSLLHVPPYHWYYSTEIVVIIMLACFSAGMLCETVLSHSSHKNARMWILIILSLIPPLGSFYLSLEDNFLFKEMPIHTNWATPEQYKTVALWLKNNYAGSTILLQGEIGTLAYYSDCFLFNQFSDRRVIEEHVRERINEAGIKSFLYRINFLFFSNNKKYPKYEYQLLVKKNRTMTDSMNGTSWMTHSKWFPSTMIIFEKY